MGNTFKSCSASAMDEFTTGLSSFGCLQQYPLMTTIFSNCLGAEGQGYLKQLFQVYQNLPDGLRKDVSEIPGGEATDEIKTFLNTEIANLETEINAEVAVAASSTGTSLGASH